jgi:hypothetical protein
LSPSPAPTRGGYGRGEWGLTYYRLADGKIAEDDLFQTPDMTALLGPLMAPPSA